DELNLSLLRVTWMQCATFTNEAII
ncbi:hypothetical protein RRG08_017542, partial [Elysia crispata]